MGETFEETTIENMIIKKTGHIPGEWKVVKAELSGSEIFVDLYKYSGITSIRVTADKEANATITIYA